MKTQINCEMIRDLIPLYIDNLCSETSRQAIEEHLEECSECRDFYAAMNTAIADEPGSPAPEIDYLKAYNKKIKRRSRAAAVFGSLLTLLLAGLIGRFYLIGRPASLDEINFDPITAYNALSTGMASLKGELASSGKAVRKIVVYNDNRTNDVLRVEIYTVNKSFFFPDSRFDIPFSMDETKQVHLQEQDNREIIYDAMMFAAHITCAKDNTYQEGQFVFDRADKTTLARIVQNSTQTKIPQHDEAPADFIQIKLEPMTNEEFAPTEETLYLVYEQGGSYLLDTFTCRYNPDRTIQLISSAAYARSISPGEYQELLRILSTPTL